MKKQNGYSIAARLCEYSTSGGTNLPFPILCQVFGPVYWEKLTTVEKLYFKRLAIQYRQTVVGTAERAGSLPTREAFLTAVFGDRAIEQEKVRQELQLAAMKLSHMTYSEIHDVIENL